MILVVLNLIYVYILLDMNIPRKKNFTLLVLVD